jgi:ribonuclease P protein component
MAGGQGARKSAAMPGKLVDGSEFVDMKTSSSHHSETMHEQDDISAAQDPRKRTPDFWFGQDQERPGRPAPQTGQGTQTSGRLISPPERRLRLRRRFTACYDSGRKYFTRHFVVFALLRPADGMAFRLGLTVGKKCGGAVARNRIKRVLRELFRLYWSELIAAGHRDRGKKDPGRRRVIP